MSWLPVADKARLVAEDLGGIVRDTFSPKIKTRKDIQIFTHNKIQRKDCPSAVFCSITKGFKSSLSTLGIY